MHVSKLLWSINHFNNNEKVSKVSGVPVWSWEGGTTH